MSKVSKINSPTGPFADVLRLASEYFLYIFVAEDAKLPAEVMRKRKVQLWVMDIIDQVNTVYSAAELKEIVYYGIKEKYGVPPSQLLTDIYTSHANVAGIGADVVETPTTTETDFWATLPTIATAVASALTAINTSLSSTSISSGLPASTDWDGVTKTDTVNDLFTAYWPYLAIGGILLWYFISKKKKDS